MLTASEKSQIVPEESLVFISYRDTQISLRAMNRDCNMQTRLSVSLEGKVSGMLSKVYQELYNKVLVLSSEIDIVSGCRIV